MRYSITYSTFFKITVLICYLIALPAMAENKEMSTADLLQQAQTAFNQGNFEQAIRYWQSVSKNSEKSLPFETQIHFATAYQSLGNYPSAYGILQNVQSFIEEQGTDKQKVLLYSHLGDILLAMQKPKEGEQFIQEALTIARTLDEPLIVAHLLNNLGNSHSVNKNHADALIAYEEASTLAEQNGHKNLHNQLLNNQLRVHLKLNNEVESLGLFEKALAHARTLSDEHIKAFQLLSLGHLALQIQAKFSTSSHLAHPILNEVLQLAEKQGDKNLQAFAKGYLGQVYEQAGRYAEAQRLTREAIFLSHHQHEILYRWEWQLGRILEAQGKLTEAIKTYERALHYLKPIRLKMLHGHRDVQEIFRTRIKPVFFSLASALLQQAALTDSSEEKTQLLNQARDTLEQLKVAELQDYFQEECVSATKTEATQLNRLDSQTAVLYPILLPNRTELLLSSSTGIQQFLVPVSGEIIAETARKFRENLQIRVHWRFIEQSKQLYSWLIAPIRTELNRLNIKTLIIVPDGALRMIPLSALYDGEHFLIHDFALAITPSLNLTDFQQLSRQNIDILLNGLSEGVQGFSPLPSVPDEIEGITSLFENNDILVDQHYSLDNVAQTLLKSPYSIVHVASHGQFDADPKETFLLTYDDKLTMDRLERLLSFSQSRQTAVELLTLSACQTAVGDERAALGLAGVAVKAGARSALASLWFVNDEATSKLVVEFYKKLQNPDTSKAQALQFAQKSLLEQRLFKHPIYWAPFLLIGNWL